MDRLMHKTPGCHAVPVKFSLDFIFDLDKKTWRGLSAIFERLAAYEGTGYSPEDFDKLCREMSDLRMAMGLDTYDDLRKAIQDGRVEVLPAPAKEGDKKPSCYYTTIGGIWCPGTAPFDDDEPTERCKNCWYCEHGYAAEEDGR